MPNYRRKCIVEVSVESLVVTTPGDLKFADFAPRPYLDCSELLATLH